MRSNTIFLILSPCLVFCICLLFPPLIVIAADVPMAPTAPTNSNSNSAVDTAIKAGVHATVDKNTGNIVFSADQSSGVEITAMTLERLDQEKKMYETGFFIGYVAGFKHFQKGGKFADLIAGDPRDLYRIIQSLIWVYFKVKCLDGAPQTWHRASKVKPNKSPFKR